MKVDLRSENEDEITRMETALRDCVAAGVKDEMDNARERTRGKLEWKVNLIGSRPGGELVTGFRVTGSFAVCRRFSWEQIEE